ncbi:MAG TPA: regulatory protein GemA [Aliidongia sp.]|nr:regulatory protein GemA [Aliidongia sp.]
MTAPATDLLRNRQLAAIHAGRKQLGLAEDDYRALVRRHSGERTRSAGELTPKERGELLDHLRRCGAGTKNAPSARGTDARRQAAKLRALWLSLWQLGQVERPDDAALAAFVMRQTGIEALRWNSAADLNRATEALKGWCERVGYHPEPSRMEGPCKGRYEPVLIRAQWERLIQLGVFKHGIFAALHTWLHKQGWPVSDPGWLEVEAAQEAVKRLGKWVRRVARGQPERDADG